MLTVIKKNKIVVFLLILSFIVPLIGLFILSSCQEGTVNNCISSHSNIFSDFFLYHNIVKYIAHHNGNFPTIVCTGMESTEGLDSECLKRIVYHPPFYFYLITPLYLIAKKLSISDIFLLTLFSNFLLLLGSIVFFLILKDLSKHLFLKYNKRFVIYSLSIFLFLPMHMYMCTLFITDMMLYFFTTLAIFYYFKLLNTKKIKHSILSGLMSGLGVLSRIASISILGGFILQMLILHLKKEKKARNLLFYSIIIGIGLGSFAFIKNIVAYSNPLGDLNLFQIYLPTPEGESPYRLNIRTFIRLFNSYWGGFFGGYDLIKPLIIVCVILLCAVTLFGFIHSLKKYDFWLTIFPIMALSTSIVLALHIVDLSVLITQGRWVGMPPGGRQIVVFNYSVSIFAGLGLVRLKQFIKNTKWRFLPELFIVILSLLFIIDYIYALI